MKTARALYGLAAEFTTHEQLLAAARSACAQGYKSMDAYAPFPVEGLPSALGRKRSLVPLVVLIGGIIGGSSGYFMQWYANVVSYPLNIGGRPLNSWPSFIPITFELTVLGAALFAFFGSMAMNKLPQPYHPIFHAPNFERASRRTTRSSTRWRLASFSKASVRAPSRRCRCENAARTFRIARARRRRVPSRYVQSAAL